jgi:hypothetical protein
VRTTLNIDDDVLRAARSLAALQGKALGQVISELARRGLRPAPPAFHEDLPVFDVSEKAPPITPEMVRRALEES